MQLNMNSIFQLMLGSSLLSGEGFNIGNFMGDLTFDKLLGLSIISGINFDGALNIGGQQSLPTPAQTAPSASSQGLTKQDLMDIIKAYKSNDAV